MRGWVVVREFGVPPSQPLASAGHLSLKDVWPACRAMREGPDPPLRHHHAGPLIVASIVGPIPGDESTDGAHQLQLQAPPQRAKSRLSSITVSTASSSAAFRGP